MATRLRIGLLLLVLVPMVAAPLVRSGTAQETEEADQPKPSFSATFWKWLQDVKYQESFSAFPEGSEDSFRPGKSPHGEKLRVYINSPARKSWENPDRNSVIVKENYNEDEELQSITVMYRTREGYDAGNKDWYWAKYLPDGTVAEMGDMKLAGKVQGCIDCHKGAGGEDYLFLNDKAADNAEADTPDSDTPDADNTDADNTDADTPDSDSTDADTPDSDSTDADETE